MNWNPQFEDQLKLKNSGKFDLEKKKYGFYSTYLYLFIYFFFFAIIFYRLEKLADACRTKLILEAEAESESLRLKGEAEAFAIEIKAKAEADQMLKKAEAMKEYKEAALIEMVLDCLPKVRSKCST